MDLSAFQKLNAERSQRWHNGNLGQWSLLEWTGAMCGEAGEAANTAKKIKRLANNLPNIDAGLSVTDKDALEANLAAEIADTIIYGLIILSMLEMPASKVIADVFNAKSIEYGFPERAEP